MSSSGSKAQRIAAEGRPLCGALALPSRRGEQGVRAEGRAQHYRTALPSTEYLGGRPSVVLVAGGGGGASLHLLSISTCWLVARSAASHSTAYAPCRHCILATHAHTIDCSMVGWEAHRWARAHPLPTRRCDTCPPCSQPKRGNDSRGTWL